MSRLIAAAAAAMLAVGIAGCGEKTGVTVYKPGNYQGKVDSQPWDNERFKGDKLAWENAIKQRNEKQNEYSRGTPTAN
jgi:hypothetical protein